MYPALDKNKKKVACITGGTGIIGKPIVKALLKRGHEVRILTRKTNSDFDPQVIYFKGSVDDRDSLVPFLRGCNMLFHCAGEKCDELKMLDVNVRGTEQILSLIQGSDIEYFCYISSAGVIGNTADELIDESTPCNPQNTYETSKYAAENRILQETPKNPRCKTVILRPTNVIDDDHPGALNLALRSSFSDKLMMFLKGGECAHIVHAEDVAQAALYLSTAPIDSPACFFVSCDDDKHNTFVGLWRLYTSMQRRKPITEIRPPIHLPIIIPHILRRLRRGPRNSGNVRFSSKKLLSLGFQLQIGVEGAVRRIAALKSGLP